jgi:hypothetical protein
MKEQTYYKNTPLDEESLAQYKQEFVGFGTIIKNTLDISKQEFVRLFLKPVLWQLAIVVLPILLISMSFVYKVVSTSFDQNVFTNGVASISRDENSPAIAEFSTWLTNNFAVGILVLLFALTFFVVLGALMNYRTIYLFNDTTIKSIWKTPRAFYVAFFQIVTVVLAYSLLGWVIDGLVGNPNTASILKNILALVFYGLFGLYEYLIIFEQNTINESLQKSYTYSKPYFWKNALRWLQFTLLVTATALGVILATGIWIIPAAVSNWHPISILLLGAMIIIGIGCMILLNFVTEVFTYLSFLNLRLLEGKIPETNKLDSSTSPENTL